MTKQELDVIRERCKKATPGPWENRFNSAWGKKLNIASKCEPVAFCQEEQDAEFIAHARTDIPLLLAEIDRLQTERDALGRGRMSRDE